VEGGGQKTEVGGQMVEDRWWRTDGGGQMVEDRWWTSLSRGILGGIWFSFAKAMEDFIDGLGNYGYVLYRQICEKGYHRDS
jgi:hypothetical protein